MKFKKTLASLLTAVLAFGTVAVHTVAAASEPPAVGEQSPGTNNDEDKEYTITIEPQTGGTVTVENDITKAKAGETVKLTATANGSNMLLSVRVITFDDEGKYD